MVFEKLFEKKKRKLWNGHFEEKRDHEACLNP